MNALSPAPRVPDHPVDAMFIDRHSGRAYASTPLVPEELLTLLEAARWAPSGSNTQPTRLVWGLRGDPTFARIAETLAPGNKLWAEKAAALVVVASKTHMTRDDSAEVALPSHAFDAGAAWMGLALQAHLRGWMAHAMGGFDKARAAEDLGLTGAFHLHVVVAIGQEGDPALLSEGLRAREVPSGRLPLAQIARNTVV